MKQIITILLTLLLLSLTACGELSETSLETQSTEQESEAEKFAKANDISVALAENIEQALAESVHSYSLSRIYEWKQIDDWSDGERYTGYMDMEYVWVFYVKGDSLESIKQQKGLSEIWKK